MSQFRRFRGFPPPLVGTRAHEKDPRTRPPAYSPGAGQPDVAQFLELTRAWEAGMIPLEVVISRLDAKNLPPGVRNTPYLVSVAPGQGPQLLLPANPRRMAFLVSNPNSSGGGSFSYGPHPTVDAAGDPLGVPLGDPGFYQEANGTVSLDDIYVWGSDGVHTFTFVAYEGVLAFETGT